MLIVHADARILRDRLPEVKKAIESLHDESYSSIEVAIEHLGFSVEEDYEGDLVFNNWTDSSDDHDFIEGLDILAPFFEGDAEFVVYFFMSDCSESAFRRFLVEDGKVREEVGNIEWEEVDDEDD